MSLDEMVRKYVITSAQRGAEPNSQFLDSIDNYARRNGAEVIVLPLRGCYKDDVNLHPRLQEYTIVDDADRRLNNNLQISDWEVPPTQVDPISGVKRFAHGGSSFIFGSPKQRLEYVAVPSGHIPKAVMSTGAVTEPFYKTHTAVGKKAEHDHEYGAVIVDVVNEQYFHFRFIKANKHGGFSDITGEYNGKKYKAKPSVEAIVVGDLHPYDTDPAHERNTFDQIKRLGPKAIFLHDAFNGKSISHHYRGHNIERHNVYESQGLDLGAELAETARAITKYATAVNKGKVYVVKSNHDEHLERYLDEGRFIGDKGNDLVAARLYVNALEGRNPLVAGLALYGGVPSNVHFLSRDDSVKLSGYQLANHGDLGANGARPSMASTELANGASITAHTHSPAKLRNTYVVGTSTRLRLSYNRGYSSWAQTNAIVYTDGGVQLINTIGNSWRAK
jgi:hypothetical protein